MATTRLYDTFASPPANASLNRTPSSHQQPLLDTKDERDLALDIVGDPKTAAFVAALLQHAPLPEKISWKHAPAALFTTATCAAGSVLYALGGSKLGLKYTIGGVGINVPQNALYGFGTWDFFSHFYNNAKHAWKRCLAATALGFTATLPSTFATWKLSDQGWWGYVQTGLTFAGNLPGNIYGMYDAVKRPLDYRENNPKLREFLLDEFREALPAEYQSLVGEPRGAKAKVASRAMGGVLGTSLAASLTGYICSTSQFMADYVGKIGGIAFGVFTNSPTLLIALLISGLDFAEDVVDFVIDTYKHVSGDEKMIMTEADKKYLAGYLLLVAGFTYMDIYSGGTSQVLYDGDCPSFGEIPSDILRRDVIQGTEFFNEILMALAFHKGLKYTKQAYDKNEDHREIYRIRNVVSYLKKGPIKELKDIAKEHFEGREAAWDKTEATTEKKSAGRSWLPFWRKEPNATPPAATTQHTQPETIPATSASPAP